MPAFKSILVDVDATATAHPALERAIRLARSIGATLTVTDVMTVPPHAGSYLPAALEEDIVRDQRQQLARIADGVRDVRAESKLLVGRPATALIQEILSSSHDLLMRSHARELAAPGPKPSVRWIWSCLRKCPCPVLLARHGSPARDPQIVGAVNASTEEADEQALNAKIVELTLLVASHLDAAPPRLLHAWAPFAERKVRRHSADEQFAATWKSARQRAAARSRASRPSVEGRAQPAPAPGRARRGDSRVRCRGRHRPGRHGYGGAFRHFGNADRQHGGADTQEVAVFSSGREAGWIRESCSPRSVLK